MIGIHVLRVALLRNLGGCLVDPLSKDMGQLHRQWRNLSVLIDITNCPGHRMTQQLTGLGDRLRFLFTVLSNISIRFVETV